MGYALQVGKGGFQVSSIEEATLPVSIFDFDFSQTSKFVLENSGGFDYVESYTDSGLTLVKSPSVASNLRPYLDSNGVRFQDNAQSHLFSSVGNTNAKEMWTIFNCLQGTTYKATDGNYIGTVRKTSSIPILRGDASSTRVSQLGFGTGATGGISNVSWTSFQNLGVSNNASPINAFRVAYISFPNVTSDALYIGAGTNTATSIAPLRALNGYIKRVLLFSAPLTTEQRTLLLSTLKTDYGV